MNIVMLDVKTLGDDLSFEQFEHFGELSVYSATSQAEVETRISDADVVIVNKVKMNEAALAGVKKLKLICVTATGYDNIDIEYCRAHGIGVCNVTGYSTDSVAQITAAMALSLYSHIGSYNRYVAEGRYTLSGVQNHLNPVYHEISGKTWGILGLGNIGRRVAHIAEALGCTVLVFKRIPDEHFMCTDVDTICSNADILSLHLPLTLDTYNILNARRINMMKQNAVLINVSRGAVMDEDAAVRAYENGLIGGLGIDVYSSEPIPEDSPYMRIAGKDNVILTPHMAWGAYESRVRCMKEIEKNIDDFLRGGKRNRIV